MASVRAIMPLKLSILVSGKGGNFVAIARAIDAGTCDAHIARVISDRASAGALELAHERGTPTSIVSPRDQADRAAWDQALTQCVAQDAPDLIVLAGFMRLVGPMLLGRFEHRVINVHPALLPAFPGMTAPGDALAAGARISGCTVHLVDAGIDTGPIIAQAAVPVLEDDTAETLHARIARAEHVLYPRVIDGIAKHRISLGPRPRTLAPARDAGQVLFSPDWRDGQP